MSRGTVGVKAEDKKVFEELADKLDKSQTALFHEIVSRVGGANLDSLGPLEAGSAHRPTLDQSIKEARLEQIKETTKLIKLKRAAFENHLPITVKTKLEMEKDTAEPGPLFPEDATMKRYGHCEHESRDLYSLEQVEVCKELGHRLTWSIVKVESK